jgi:hypothetical protein
MLPTISIARRFNGPPQSGNGGYVSGLIAKAIGETLQVRLLKPPPLDEPLTIEPSGGHTWQLLHSSGLIATASSTTITEQVPDPPPYIEALGVSKHYAGFHEHIFPTCFVCGPERARGDGLRIFPGTLPNSTVVAAPWLPDTSLADANGKVRPEFIWAVLDCPGYYASTACGRRSMLGELAVHIDRSVHVDEPCVVIGWPIKVDGRKHRVGTALFDEDGERCAAGVATWIELK